MFQNTVLRVVHTARRPFSMAWLTAITIAATGCGSGDRLPTAPTAGRVTLDGQPVPHGDVVFLPVAGRPAQGELAADGTFTLQTYSDSDGAIVGEHRVGVVAYRGELPTEENPSAPIEWVVPDRYGNPNTSGLTYMVRPGQTNEASFELQSVPQ